MPRLYAAAFLVPLVIMLGWSATPSLNAVAWKAAPSPVSQTPPSVGSPVTVRVDENVETLGILMALAFDYQFGEFTLPAAAGAQRDLSAHREHPAVVTAREMVRTLGIDGYTGLALYAEPFGGEAPGRTRLPLPASWRQGAGDGDEAAGRVRIEAFLQAVGSFYREADLSSYFALHRAAYEQTVAEVRRLAPSAGLIADMEGYFGERLRSYTILPTLVFPPYGNVGRAIDCSEEAGPPCRDAYFVLGTRISVTEDALLRGEAAGFDDPAAPDDSRQYVSDLVVHEFGHAFVNPYLETPEVWAAIEELDSLMLPPLRDRMAPQAYTQWTAVAVEHIVRTAEVRVALTAGDTARAERLRRHYIDERAFVYLPWLEAAAARFEQSRRADPDRPFGTFVPEMVQAFRTVDTRAAYEALGIGFGPPRRVTIRVAGAVPVGDTVFVTGGHAALNDWNPRGAPLQPTEDGTWTGTVDIPAGTRLEYKVTRGSWDTEAADESGRPLPNAAVTVRSDTTVHLRVLQWKDAG